MNIPLNIKELFTERKELVVSEIFGPTIQGEGMAAGRHCIFIRTANCNLECTWCDTPYTWAYTPDKAQKHVKGIQYDKLAEQRTLGYDEALEAIKEKWPVDKTPTIAVWSGGEPLMQQPAIEPIAAMLAIWGSENHFETAGTIMPTEMIIRYATQFNVSPKLQHSGNRLSKRFRPDVLIALSDTGKARFKFVVVDEDDFYEIDSIVNECRIPRQFVQVMPEGNTLEGTIEGARDIIDQALRRGYGLSMRQHVLLWGEKRGV